jgi:hypothetical protein
VRVEVIQTVQKVFHFAELIFVLTILCLNKYLEFFGTKQKRSASDPSADGEEDRPKEEGDERMSRLFGLVIICEGTRIRAALLLLVMGVRRVRWGEEVNRRNEKEENEEQQGEIFVFYLRA